MITQDFYRTKVMNKRLTKRDTIDLKVMTDFSLHGVKPRGIVTVEVDKDGMPFDKNWRKRVIDSKIDGCVEVIEKKTIKKDKD